ncbi:MAG: tRNA pseudouridine(55) synthase TruB [Anaerolineae bacterium]|nr:tRNA pseudouridine(55) synthase TruB [Anaerolineae bacterium]
MTQLSGVVLVDKPVGPTSHDVVAAVRRAVGQKRVGHAGTLDPLAEGLLLVLLGSATRLAEYLVGHDKAYCTEARLSIETDTYDTEGRVTRQWTGDLPSDAEIGRALAGFVGPLLQTPPAYSAVKVGGQPLHRLARRGTATPVAPRRVTIHSLDWRRLGPEHIVLHVHCSAGTYIRSLVHDLGAALGCGAHVTRLRRIQSGPFSVEDALPLSEALERLADGDERVLLGPAAALPHWPRINLGPEEVAGLRLGRAVSGPRPQTEAMHLAVGPDGDVVAIVARDSELELWRPRKVFSEEIAG